MTMTTNINDDNKGQAGFLTPIIDVEQEAEQNAETNEMPGPAGLRRDLRARHINMITIAGMIVSSLTPKEL